MKKGDKGPAVLEVQKLILQINPSALPRFGADSSLGDESLHAAAIILGDRDPQDIEELDEIEIGELTRRAQLTRETTQRPMGFLDFRPSADKTEEKGRRAPSQIDSVVLHQTACYLGENPTRWRSVPIHFGVTRTGKIICLHDLEVLLYHAHALNKFSVGIEIDGYFEGIEGDKKTLYNPPSDPQRAPLALNESQRIATLELISYIAKELENKGGKLSQILAHRQGTDMRRSDPGSQSWREIALPAMAALGILPELSRGRVWGKGQPIPKEWDGMSPAKY